MRKRIFQIGLFFFLLLLIETFLRLSGNSPGVLSNSLYPIDSLIYQPRFKTDSLGMASYIKNSPFLPEGYHINEQGFRSNVNFDKRTIDSLRLDGDKKVVFLVGDSYTEGCCAEPVTNSFSDLLSENGEYVVLNFGVGGTGLNQYSRILEHFVPELRPDLVIINFYLGNDLIHYRTSVVPNIPHTYPIKGYKWLASKAPQYFMVDHYRDHLATPQEAYGFYLSNYTLWHDHTTFFERMIRRSVLFSRIYLGIREKYYMAKWAIDNYRMGQSVRLTKQLLLNMGRLCEDNGGKMVVVGIPTPENTDDRIDLKNGFSKYFEGTDHQFPDISQFSKDDYDGMAANNHFNNSGHRKFYIFLKDVIDNRTEN